MDFTGTSAAFKDEFNKRALCPEDQIDLARAGFLISRLAYPDLDEAFYLAELDKLGGRLRSAIGGLTDVGRIAQMIAFVLFEEARFRGNFKDYYDPENSCLNRVLDRKTGIPITLSMIYMEVGKRSGLNVRGIGMPGHFIVGVYGAEGRMLMDPFYRGVVLSEEECCRRVAVQYGGVFGPRFLEPVGPKVMLVRLLRNLRGIYSRMGEKMKAFQALEWMIALDPNAAAEFKARAFIYESRGAFDLAARDMEKYLSLAPDSPDARTIRSKLQELKEKASRLH